MAHARKRVYESPLRAAQTADTRRKIIEAATAEFVRHGYVKASMGAIAAAAGVSRETVYHVLGNKKAVLKACWDVTIVGDDAPVPVAERPEYRTMLSEPDPTTAARTFGQLSASLVGRIGPLLRVLDDAAHEPELRTLLDQTRTERLEGTRSLLAQLSGADPDTRQFAESVDVLYAMISPELALVLVEQRGWSLDAYGTWLSQQVVEHVQRLRTADDDHGEAIATRDHGDAPSPGGRSAQRAARRRRSSSAGNP